MDLKSFGDKHQSAKWVLILWPLFLILFLDIVTKQIIQNYVIRTTNHFLDITYVTNTGTLWSLFSSVQSINIVFILLSFLALGFLFYYAKTEKDHYIPISIIAGGILGNLVDRVLYGYVIDWINFHFFPIFNIADSAIVCGVSVLIFLLVQEEFKKHPQK